MREDTRARVLVLTAEGPVFGTGFYLDQLGDEEGDTGDATRSGLQLFEQRPWTRWKNCSCPPWRA